MNIKSQKFVSKSVTIYFILQIALFSNTPLTYEVKYFVQSHQEPAIPETVDELSFIYSTHYFLALRNGLVGGGK